MWHHINVINYRNHISFMRNRFPVIYRYLQIALQNLKFFTVKSPSFTENHLQNMFKKCKTPVAYFAQIIYSLLL